jgi:hypothetical protein
LAKSSGGGSGGGNTSIMNSMGGLMNGGNDMSNEFDESEIIEDFDDAE